MYFEIVEVVSNSKGMKQKALQINCVGKFKYEKITFLVYCKRSYYVF